MNSLSPNTRVTFQSIEDLCGRVHPSSAHDEYCVCVAGSVFCVGLDPVTNSLAVTGGEDDRAFVWSVTDGDVLFECTG